MLLRKRFKLRKNQKGMTLIELMAVVVILGILATVAGAAVVNSFTTAKTNSDSATDSVLTDAAQRYILEQNPTASSGGAYTISVTDLVNNGYIKEAPTKQTGTDASKTYATIIANPIASGTGGFTYSFTYN